MLTEFFKDEKGNYSHTRLISIIGSFIVLGLLLFHPTNDGLQNIVLGILAASLTNATVSKFANRRQRKVDNPDGENYED
jgi:uncharacterized membrane protein YeaQ/YmgE (transglycosylase-associated protein family)